MGPRVLFQASGNFIPFLAASVLYLGPVFISGSNLTLGLCLDFFTDVTPPQTAGYIEVTDLQSKRLRYIPIPG